MQEYNKRAKGGTWLRVNTHVFNMFFVAFAVVFIRYQDRGSLIQSLLCDILMQIMYIYAWISLVCALLNNSRTTFFASFLFVSENSHTNWLYITRWECRCGWCCCYENFRWCLISIRSRISVYNWITKTWVCITSLYRLMLHNKHLQTTYIYSWIDLF